MATLTAILAGGTTLAPSLDVDGTTILGMKATIFINWVDDNNVVQATTQKTIPIWSVLSSQQKVNMQDIRDTIAAAVAAGAGL